jgi:hypothetical protein
MLGRAGETRNPPHERVVATVRPSTGLRQQRVQPMRRERPTAGRHLDTQRTQPRSRHRHDQRGFGLVTRCEVLEPGTHELMPWEAALSRQHAQNRRPTAGPTPAGRGSPGQQILAVFDFLHEWFSEPDFRGCPFTILDAPDAALEAKAAARALLDASL